MLGKLRLDQHLARPLGAARASGYLHDALREALARAEIDAEQSLVRVQHDHQRDAGEVMSFREHLCADQEAHLAARDPVERVLERAAAAHGVAVDACERHIREQLPEHLLDPLGALADRPYGLSARGADLWNRLLRAAMM